MTNENIGLIMIKVSGKPKICDEGLTEDLTEDAFLSLIVLFSFCLSLCFFRFFFHRYFFWLVLHEDGLGVFNYCGFKDQSDKGDHLGKQDTKQTKKNKRVCEIVCCFLR